MSKKNIALLGLGGCGIETVNRVKQRVDTPNPFMNLTTIGFDTSRSNVSGKESSFTSLFLLGDETGEKVDGSGQDPKTNYPLIQAQKPKISGLIPSDVDGVILVAGAGGGSGSAFIRVIVPDLIERKIPFVALVVGDSNTFQFADTTVKTLKSLQNYAINKGVSYATEYFENNHEYSQATVDANVLNSISVISMMMSGVAKGLDSKDVATFLNPTALTKCEVTGVSTLFHLANDETYGRSSYSVAQVLLSIQKEGTEPMRCDVPVHATFTGYVEQAPETTALISQLPVAVLNTTGCMTSIIKDLEGRIAEMQRQLEAARANDKPVKYASSNENGDVM